MQAIEYKGYTIKPFIGMHRFVNTVKAELFKDGKKLGTYNSVAAAKRACY